MKELLPLDTAVRSPAHGMVALADAASFNNTHFSEPLTTFAVGWRDPSNLQGMLDFLAPGVRTSRRFEFRKANAAADFLVDSDDERAVGADFKRVKSSGTIEQSKTVNRGLTTFVDMDEVGMEQDWQQEAVGMLMRRSVRNDLVAAIALAVAGAENTPKTWDSASDPDADLIALCEASGDAMGFNPNRIAFLGAAWTKRLTALRAKTTAGGFAGIALTTPSEVARYCGFQEGMDINARYQSAAAAKAKVGGGAYAIALYAEAGLTKDDPSNMKRFWSPCGDGTQYRVYVRQVNEKCWAVTVERYVRIVATGTVGLLKYTVS
jgi:hypothetical protein